MAIGDLYTLHLHIDVNHNPTQCVLGFEQLSGVVDADTLEATCQAWITNAKTELLAILSDQSEFSRITMQTVTDHSEVPGLIDNINFVGTNAGEALPAAFAACFNLKTDAPNAKHNGRIFVAGCPENEQQEGLWDVAMITLLDAFAAKLDDNITPLSPQVAVFKPVVISRFVLGVKRTPPIGFNMIQAISRSHVRQQRRRKTGTFGLQ